MVDLKSVLSGFVIGFTIAASGGAFAESAGKRAAAADAVSPPPAPPVKILEAGNIRAELLTIGENKTLAAEGAAFAQVKLSTGTAAKKGINAELLVEASHGEVVSITGSGSKAEGNGPAARVQIDGLRKGRDRNLLVEMKLPKAESDRTTLKVTLRALSDAGQPAGKEAATEIAWSIKDCAGGYYGALQEIRNQSEWQATERWKAAAKADPNLPKGWLFAPREERRSRRRRRQEPEVTAASPIKNQREIFAEASKIARAGRDTALDRDGNLGWTLGKASSDLDSYLSQPINPAICTGAPGFADYYEKRLADLVKRGEKLTVLAADAKRLAQDKAATAFRMVRELSDETPGWGGVTPVAAKAMAIRDDSLTGLAASLAELAAVPAEILGKVRQAQTPYAALVPIHDAGIGAKGMPEALRDSLSAAFAAIDAAARLEVIRERHAGVQGAFEGRIKAIRDAHGKHCVCQS
jgi:hypothetical protein